MSNRRKPPEFPSGPIVLEAEGFIPLSYHFLHVDSFPSGGATFRTDTSPMFFKDADDHPTEIRPLALEGDWPDGVSVYEIRTVTEHHQRVFANGDWVNSYLRRAVFRAFYAASDQLLIVATSSDGVRSLLKSCRAFSGGLVKLLPYMVSVNGLKDIAKNARSVTLVHESNSGLIYGIERMQMRGTNLEATSEYQSFTSTGGTARGLVFEFDATGIGKHNVSVSADGAIRLISHIGAWLNPEIDMELTLALECWRDLVNHHATVKRPKSTESVHHAPGPLPAQGQHSLDDALERHETLGGDDHTGSVQHDGS